MRKNRRRHLRKTILVIVDGESEQIYLNNFKNSNTAIKPELPKRKALNDLYTYFKKEKENYDKSFWIIDLDVPIRENRIHDIKNFKQNYSDEIIINHPCLEFWFLLHYEVRNFNNNCNEIISYLKRAYSEFNNYNKSADDIKKVLPHLKNKIQNAIENSRQRECNLDSLINCSEMFKFFEEIE